MTDTEWFYKIADGSLFIALLRHHIRQMVLARNTKSHRADFRPGGFGFSLTIYPHRPPFHISKNIQQIPIT